MLELNLALLLVICYLSSVEGQGECTDLRGRLISHGLHYVPGPDTCTLCICDNGSPKVCKAVLCSPPQDCRSFRVGNTCCDFICLDDVVKPVEGGESNVRAAAGGAAAVVLVTAALVWYRVQRHKRRRTTRAEHHRSLTSIGYISGSMGYMGGTCETALAAWKPGHPPRGEAPPPYDEVVAQCRADNAIRSINEGGFHRSFPSVEPPREDSHCRYAYSNIPRPIHQMANPQVCYNAPLLQPAHAQEFRDGNIAYHPLALTASGFGGGRLTGSLGAIAARPHHPHPHQPHHASQHRTIPRISTAIDTTILDTSLSVFNRADRSLYGEIRRSFHKPNEARHLSETGRSMPRNLNIVSSAEIIRHPEPVINVPNTRIPSSNVERIRTRSEEIDIGARPMPLPAPPRSPLPAPLLSPLPAPLLSPLPAPLLSPLPVPLLSPLPAPLHSPLPAPLHSPLPAPMHSPLPSPIPATLPAPDPPVNCTTGQTLPLTIDKPSCVCSYSSGCAPGGDEPDDYRNECENCKAANSSRWAVMGLYYCGPEPSAQASESSQTLERRPAAPSAAPPAAPPAPATLPGAAAKNKGNIIGPPSNWENWFNTIPDSDTESEEE